ncbi:hypothetical protein [Desulfosporosinus sp. Sb-LF]|uniref:hypothetical protein n=1 Tax=Desulfosporosinus sp. Sb-LF TaxID=2560027 RepID=UPI00107F58B0|nr:hypothetical protein [Desulfosporosinus sp. Sb-LF]TGE32415.1 hypothetical protein E4K68_12530 [Desulfosporosinus sp. Sb-LF]
MTKALVVASLRIQFPVLLFKLISIRIMEKLMKSLDIFKEYMSSSQVPNYVRRYCDSLDEFKWQWFYNQMIEPMEFVADTDYLFYVLK